MPFLLRRRTALAAVTGLLTAALVASPALSASASPYEPTAPTHVTATRVTSSTATIVWSPPATSGWYWISGYRVSRDGYDNRGEGAWATTVSRSARAFTFTRLRSATTYNLTVRPVFDDTWGPATTIAVPALSRLAAPSNVSIAQVGDHAATIRWSAPTVRGGRTITGYVVSRNGEDSTGLGSYSKLVSGSTRSFTMTRLLAYDAYRLTVRAVTSSGEFGPKASANVWMWNW